MDFNRKRPAPQLSRRKLLKALGIAPLALRTAPLCAWPRFAGPAGFAASLSFAESRFVPHYPEQSPLADILRFVAPGSDSYGTEKYAAEIEEQLRHWAAGLKTTPRDHSALAQSLDAALTATPLSTAKESPLRTGFGIDTTRRSYGPAAPLAKERFLSEIAAWIQAFSRIETAEFEIFAIDEIGGQSPPGAVTVRTQIRYDLVATRNDSRREERVGSWTVEWHRMSNSSWRATRWEAATETAGIAGSEIFVDVTQQAIGGTRSYSEQMQRGVDYWRTVLDGACAIDVYSNNGIAAADFDNDGFDDFYVCQPAGLPNRLYRNRGDGTFDDVTDRAGVGVLDNTACALFADFENKGVQDLLVSCGSGPLLFLNQGDGTFKLKKDAFKFSQPPQGAFTHAALADYDNDGRLDIYLCTYMYYLGLDQYHYPVPYFDARNGPPNCLMHNEGNSSFVEVTQAAGLNADNNRYTFACAWGDSTGNGRQDLFVANDFGTSQLYRNNGDGTFKVVSKEAGVENVGAGMGCSWCDFDNDGHQDVYVPSMWEAAGQRVTGQKQFHPDAPESIRELYRRHARGNALYKNQGDGSFINTGHQSGVDMGRWSWSSDFWDFDHDGYPDLYVANGYVSAPDRNDVAGFFWRQVVAKSPEDATATPAYEHGWNAINELIRSDSSWHGYARNVMFSNNRDGTFTEVSGAVGLDFLEDCRSFALADIDHDGRLEILLRSRNAPQLRILRNAMKHLGNSISFQLRGTKSNRDAVGAEIVVHSSTLKQTRHLQAGTGFLAQHSKEAFFGIGDEQTVSATVRWPGGLTQNFDNLPANHSFEIVEGSAKFVSTPFASPPSVYLQPRPAQPPAQLPENVATWLIQPLKAPEFDLPDMDGHRRQVSQWLGKPALLTFFAAKSQPSLEQLRLLNRSSSRLPSRQLAVLAINLDNPADAAEARRLVAGEKLSFPTVFADQETGGVYNIVYRYLFDRRRDLPLPASFLLDKDGMIVKIYQGNADLNSILKDAASIPETPAARLERALPFRGDIHLSAFQRNEFTYGVALFQHGYLTQAEESFRQVVVANPDDAEAYYNLGTLNLRRNNFTDAQRYLEQSLKLRPDYPEAWNNLGMIAAQQGQPDQAVTNFEQALQQRPGYTVALVNLGNLFRRRHQFDKAQEQLTRALAIEPGDPEANYSLGMLYAQQNDTANAETYLQKAIELRPVYPEALNNLGVLYVRLENYPEAEQQFKTCIRLAPSFDQSYLNLARLYALRSDRDSARAVLADLLRLQPDNTNAKQALAVLQ